MPPDMKFLLRQYAGVVEKVAAALPKDAEVVVYRVGPHCPRGGYAAEELPSLGSANACAYEGGSEGWKGHGKAGAGPAPVRPRLALKLCFY